MTIQTEPSDCDALTQVFLVSTASVITRYCEKKVSMLDHREFFRKNYMSKISSDNEASTEMKVDRDMKIHVVPTPHNVGKGQE